MEESASAEIQEANDLIINVKENAEIQREADSSTGKESQNEELHSEENSSIENEDQDTKLANDITEWLESSMPSSSGCSIYRVPFELLKLKKEIYTPQVISIGPFYHQHKGLETMEMLKMICFRSFVQKAASTVKELVSTIRNREGDVRRCYAEISTLNSNNYVEMILLDASFIIVFFLISRHEEWIGHENQLQINFFPVLKDIWLLENQLPFFIIEEVYNLAFASYSNYPSFAQLAFEFFEDYNTQEISHDPNLKILHFIDLLRTFFLPPLHRLPERSNDVGIFQHLYTASQLDEAGVKFKVGSSKCLFDLKFSNGVLEIPCLTLWANTESHFRNLVALEQCHYFSYQYVTDYIIVLDLLINTPKDVDLLVQKGILVNTLGDSNAVTTMVNNLSQRIAYLGTNSNYCNLWKDLKTFCEVLRHRWKATLRRDYFSTPWRIASTVAATVLLVLTFTQTVCSIISLP